MSKPAVSDLCHAPGHLAPHLPLPRTHITPSAHRHAPGQAPHVHTYRREAGGRPRAMSASLTRALLDRQAGGGSRRVPGCNLASANPAGGACPHPLDSRTAAAASGARRSRRFARTRSLGGLVGSSAATGGSAPSPRPQVTCRRPGALHLGPARPVGGGRGHAPRAEAAGLPGQGTCRLSRLRLPSLAQGAETAGRRLPALPLPSPAPDLPRQLPGSVSRLRRSRQPCVARCRRAPCAASPKRNGTLPATCTHHDCRRLRRPGRTSATCWWAPSATGWCSGTRRAVGWPACRCRRRRRARRQC